MAMCKNKERYIDEQDALRVLLKRCKETRGLRCYECPECGGWHLTKTVLDGRGQWHKRAEWTA